MRVRILEDALKVYVVIFEDWEDGHVESVWSSLGLAEHEASRLQKVLNTHVDHGGYYVEEHEVREC